MQSTYITNTNYVQNPSFENDLTYWSAVSGTLTRTTSAALVGSYAAQLITKTVFDRNIAVTDSSRTSEALSATIAYTRGVNVAENVKTSEQYKIGGTLYPIISPVSVSDASSTSDAATVIIGSVLSGYETKPSIVTPLPYMYAGTTYIGQAAVLAPAGTQLFIQFNNLQHNGVQTYTATGSWQVITTTAVIADQSSFALQIGTTSATQVTLYIDAVQVEANSVASTYFDGSLGLGYHWYGVANYSGSYYRSFELEANSRSQQTNYNILVSWPKAINANYTLFTIGQSIIGGADFIPASGNGVGFFGQYQYTDYSTYGISWTTSRNIGQYPYGVMLGTAAVQLDNNSNVFTPGVDATIGQYILPQRPLILSSGYADIGQTVNVFEGLTTAPNNDVNERMTTLNAYDFVTYASSITSSTTPDQVNMKADQIIAALLLECGFSPLQFVLEPSLQPTIGYFSCYGNVVTDLIQTLCEAEQAIFFCDENGILRFWNRQHLLLNNTVQWSFNYDTITNLQQENTSIINDVIVTASPRAVQPKANIYQLTTPFVIPAAQQASVAGGTVVRNLVLNPSFERDVNYWSGGNSGAGYIPPTISQQAGGTTTSSLNTPSNYSLKSVGTAQNGGGYSNPGAVLYVGNGGFNNPNFTGNSNNAPFTVGQSYALQARIKGNAGETGYIKWGWSSNYNNSTEFSGFGQVTLTGGWDLVRLNFTATDCNGNDTSGGGKGGGGGYGGYYYIAMSTSNNTGGSALFDQVSVTEIPNLSTNPSYFDGSTPGSTTTIYQWESTPYESSSTQTPVITTPGSFVFNTSFSDPANSVDLPIYASALSTTTSSFTTNYNQNGTGLTGAGYVSASNGSALGGNYSVTFQNTATQPIWITSLDLFGQIATVTNTIDQEYKDLNSILQYGVDPANNYTPLSIENDAIQDVGTALSLAYGLVTDYKTANARIIIDVIAMPALQFGDWVNVTQDELGTTQTYVIVGTTIADSASDGLVQTLELEVRNQAKYFQINVSSIGGTDVISP